MISQYDTLKAHHAELEAQRAGISSQLEATESRLNQISEEQRQVSIGAFTGDVALAKRFEMLSIEGGKLSARAKGLGLALENLEKRLTDSAARLQEVERREKTDRLEALTAQWEEASLKLGTKLEECGHLVDKVAGINSEIDGVCRDLGIKCESDRAERLLEAQMSNVMRGRFPHVNWGTRIYQVISLGAHRQDLLRRAGVAAEETIKTA